MATAKKSTTKKTTSKPAASKKAKPVARKSPAKKTSARKKAATPEIRSFRVAKDNPPFTTFRITRQTFYWVVLVSFIVFVQLWIISLQVEIAGLLDAQQAQLGTY